MKNSIICEFADATTTRAQPTRLYNLVDDITYGVDFNEGIALPYLILVTPDICARGSQFCKRVDNTVIIEGRS